MKLLSILLLSVLATSAAKALEPPPPCLMESSEGECYRAYTIQADSYTVEGPGEECAKNPGCDGVSSLEVTYKAMGCLDEVVVTELRDGTVTANGKLRVILSAINLHNPQSDSAMCVAMPQKTISMYLGRGSLTKDDVEVIQLSEMVGR
jgi:hypothetical protein